MCRIRLEKNGKNDHAVSGNVRIAVGTNRIYQNPSNGYDGYAQPRSEKTVIARISVRIH